MLIIEFLGFIDLNHMITSSIFCQEKAEHEVVGHLRMLVCTHNCLCQKCLVEGSVNFKRKDILQGLDSIVLK